MDNSLEPLARESPCTYPLHSATHVVLRPQEDIYIYIYIYIYVCVCVCVCVWNLNILCMKGLISCTLK
jgi:hypothetical protein